MVPIFSAIGALAIMCGLGIYIYIHQKHKNFDLTPRDKYGNPIKSNSDQEDEDEDDPMLAPINDPDSTFEDWETFEDFLKEVGIINITNGMIEYETGNDSRLFVMIAEMAQSNPTLKTEQEMLMDISAQEVFFNSLNEPLKMSSLSQKVDMTDFLTKLRDDSQYMRGSTPEMKEYAKDVIDDTLDYQKEQDRFENHCYLQFQALVQPDEVYGDTPEELEEDVERKALEKLFRQIDNSGGILATADHALTPLTQYGLLEMLYKTFNKDTSTKMRFEDIIKKQKYSIYTSAIQSDTLFKLVQQRIQIEKDAIDSARKVLTQQTLKKNKEKIAKGEEYYHSPVDQVENDLSSNPDFASQGGQFK